MCRPAHPLRIYGGVSTFKKLIHVFITAVLALALIYGADKALPQWKIQENVLTFLFWTQTGTWADPDLLPTPTAPVIPTMPPVREVALQQTRPTPLVLTKEDSESLPVRNGSGYDVDVDALLQQPLCWNLREEAPTVLILHTHGTESYRNTEGYPEDSAYRTLDENYNMISVGDFLTQCLEEAGIRVIHDRTAYDYPSYSGSYNQARGAVERHLQENPSLQLVIDVHRDAMADSDGNQIGYTYQTEAGTAAQLMLVAGTGGAGLSYPNWEENLSVAAKLQAALQRQCPGICRPMSIRTGRFNQDLFSNMVLIEVGAAGNTRQEALLSAQILAQAIAQLAYGTVYE